MFRKRLSIIILLLAVLAMTAVILLFARKPISRNLVTRGKSLLVEKKYSESLVIFRKAYRWDGKSAEALLGMAQSDYYLTQYSAAMDHQ
jgi:hypothetical protein